MAAGRIMTEVFRITTRGTMGVQWGYNGGTLRSLGVHSRLVPGSFSTTACLRIR